MKKIWNPLVAQAFITAIFAWLPMITPLHGQQLNETFLLARADMIRGQFSQAAQKILTVPAAERTPPMLLSLGESYYRNGEYGLALRAFAAADSARAGAEALLGAARAAAMMDQPGQAAGWLERYLAQRDKLPESELALDTAFIRMERSREWKTLWSREWYSPAERKAAETASLIKRGKFTEALAVVDGETGRSAQAQFYVLRAQAYSGLEQFEPAYGSAAAALNLRGNQPDELAAAADMAVRAGKTAAAVEHINRAVRLAPYRLDFYLRRAGVLRAAGRYEEARRDVQFYFLRVPADTEVLFQMGQAETDAGNPLGGIEFFSQLIDRDQSQPRYYVARAGACIKAGNYALANYDLAQALDLNPALTEAWLQKGVALRYEGKSSDACYYWRRALELGSTAAADYIYRNCTRKETRSGILEGALD